MNRRTLLIVVFLAFASSCQQSYNPDSKQERLAIHARLKLMSQHEFEELMAKARSGDAAAQYQVGISYGEGRHVLRNPTEASRWFLKAAEQQYPPAEGL